MSKKKNGGKRKQPPQSEHRSLAGQLRSALPKKQNPARRVDDRVPDAATRPRVRVLPSKPASPPQEPGPKKAKHLGPPDPPRWEPPDEEIVLEPKFPETVATSAIPGATTATVSSSALLAIPGIIRRRSTATVQVGLDFGTSATKVLWVRTDVPERRVQAINFRHGLSNYPGFCMPSIAAFDSRGHVAFGDIALAHLGSGPAEGALTRFKMLVAGDHDERYLDKNNQRRFREHVTIALRNDQECTPEALTVAYLAFVMRRARIAIESSVRRGSPDLTFNTCVPVDQVENSAVYSVFRRIASAAERVEAKASNGESGRRWLELAHEALAEPLIPNDVARLHLVPEAVAGTAGYLTSLQRASGLHALIDIGAGTTDVSIFNLRFTRRTEHESVWYAARSIPRGTAHLELRIAHELRHSGRPASQSDVLSVLQGVPGSPASPGKLVWPELETIWRLTHPAWAEAYGHLERQTSWTGKAVKVFLSGGGGLIHSAKTLFQESWMKKWGPYPCELVPDPDGYDSARMGGPFARVCVAYGLTIPVPELGDWTLPSSAPNHTPPPAPRRIVEDDGDQLLPKYGWT